MSDTTTDVKVSDTGTQEKKEPDTMPAEGGDATPAKSTTTTTVAKPSKMARFKKFMYNGEKGEVLGRTGNSWLKIFIFYVAFFAALAAFFFFMLFIALAFLPRDEPKYNSGRGTEKEVVGLLGNMVGLSYFPQPHKDGGTKGEPTNKFNLMGMKGKPVKDNPDLKHFVDSLDKFFESTKNETAGAIDCSDPVKKKNLNKDTEFCKVDVKPETLKCTNETNYGFHKMEACIVIKVNRNWGWKPMNATAAKPNPLKGAKGAKDSQKDTATEAFDKASDPATTPEIGIWIRCFVRGGEKKKSSAKIEYAPYPGIPSYYFPFEGQKKYVSPYIVVKLSNPIAGDNKKGKTLESVDVICRAYEGYFGDDNLDDKKRDDNVGVGDIKISLKVNKEP